MYGVKIPRSVKEALKFDEESGTKLWKEAIDKEINSLINLDVFEFHERHHQLPSDYQFAPLNIIFSVKPEL